MRVDPILLRVLIEACAYAGVVWLLLWPLWGPGLLPSLYAPVRPAARCNGEAGSCDSRVC
jgi:hypothetical protein